MGIQIEVAQTERDASDLLATLDAQFDLRCLPREFELSMASVKTLQECSATDTVLFAHQFASLVTTRINACSDAPTVYHVWPNRGLCIEWDRTLAENGIYHYGRFYLPDSDSVTQESHAFLKKVMRFIIRYIKRTSPRRSADQHPVYVGPHFCRLIDEGRAKGVAYGGGTMMTLVPNPHFGGDKGTGSGRS